MDNINYPVGSDNDNAPWNAPDVEGITKNELAEALDVQLAFDSASLENYADGLLGNIADAIRDQILTGSYVAIDLDAAIKQVAERVEQDATEMHFALLEAE